MRSDVRARPGELHRFPGLLLRLGEDPEIPERLGVLDAETPVSRVKLDRLPELLERLLQLLLRLEESGPQEMLHRGALFPFGETPRSSGGEEDRGREEPEDQGGGSDEREGKDTGPERHDGSLARKKRAGPFAERRRQKTAGSS